MDSILLLAAFIVMIVVANTIVLRDAARICKLPKRSWRRAAAITGIRFAIALLIGVVWLLTCDELGLVGGLVMTAADMAITYALICRLFGGRRGAAARAFAIQFGIGIVVSIGGMFIWHQFAEAYSMTASSMSPNLRGYHTIEVLPDGNHLVIAANDPRDSRPIAAGSPSGGIVAETFEFRESPRPAKYTHVADRFLCNKTKFPERWDAVVFKFPQDMSILYVKRLVGLPGEKLAIKENTVWINDVKLTPPARLGPIRHIGKIDLAVEWDLEPIVPPFEIVLGPDEYFVLGDNTHKSMDSRDWGPVKKDLIVGVVDAIYWPPSRWRVNP